MAVRYKDSKGRWRVRESKVKIISIGGKPPQKTKVTRTTSKGKTIKSGQTIYTKKGVTPVLSDTGRIQAFKVEQPAQNKTLTFTQNDMQGVSMSKELRQQVEATSNLESVYNRVYGNTQTSNIQSDNKIIDVNTRGDITYIERQRANPKDPFYTEKVITRDKDNKIIYQQENTRINNPSYFNVRQQKSKGFFDNYYNKYMRQSYDVGTLTDTKVIVNKSLNEPITQTERDVSSYLNFERGVTNIKNKLGYDPKAYDTSYKDFFKSYNGQWGVSLKGGQLLYNMALDTGQFVVTAVPKASTMLNLAYDSQFKQNTQVGRMARQEFKRAALETPKAIKTAYDIRKPRGLINLGLTVFAVRSVAKSPSNLGAKAYKGYRAKISNYKFSKMNKNIYSNKPFKIKQAKVTYSKITSKPTIELYKGSGKTQATLYGNRLTPKQANKLLISDKPNKIFTLEQSPLKPYKSPILRGQTSLINQNKFIALDLKNKIYPMNAKLNINNFHLRQASYYPIKFTRQGIFIWKNRQFVEFNPKQYTLININKVAYSPTAFKQPLSFSNKLYVNQITGNLKIFKDGNYIYMRGTPATTQTNLNLFGIGKPKTITLKTSFKPIKPPAKTTPTSTPTTQVTQFSTTQSQNVVVGGLQSAYRQQPNYIQATTESPTVVTLPPQAQTSGVFIINPMFKGSTTPTIKQTPLNLEPKYDFQPKTSFISIQKPSTTQKQIITPIISLKSGQLPKSATTTAQVQTPVLIQTPISTTQLIQTPKQSRFTPLKPISFFQSRLTPTTPRIPPLLPLNLPKNNNKIIFNDNTQQKKKKRRYTYQPTFYSVSTGLKGVPKPTITGLGIRPIKI